MVHTAGAPYINKVAIGCIAKSIVYKGVAAHAGGAPWSGHNALYAATCGLNAANALRETFREKDYIRFHPIITHGGDMVNAIPEQVRIESYVRGSTFEGIAKANRRINQALCGAALSIDTNVEILDMPGYSPLYNDDGMMKLAKDAATLAMPEVECPLTQGVGTGSTDMGDLSCIMPVVHPHCGGASGKGHGNDYQISNPEAACMDSAKWQMAMLLLLLEKGAERAKQILADFKPKFATKEEFLAYQDSLNDSGDRITYREDGVAEIRL
jgi:metal-dependent amidase/aminoacylase/carboxypeptidase family protein